MRLKAVHPSLWPTEKALWENAFFDAALAFGYAVDDVLTHEHERSCTQIADAALLKERT